MQAFRPNFLRVRRLTSLREVNRTVRPLGGPFGAPSTGVTVDSRKRSRERPPGVADLAFGRVPRLARFRATPSRQDGASVASSGTSGHSCQSSIARIVANSSRQASPTSSLACRTASARQDLVRSSAAPSAPYLLASTLSRLASRPAALAAWTLHRPANCSHAFSPLCGSPGPCVGGLPKSEPLAAH